MGVLLLVAFGGFVLWLVARSAGNRRLAAESGRRRDLAIFEIDTSDPKVGSGGSWRCDFGAMRAEAWWAAPDDPGTRRAEGRTRYLLRRRGDGAWDSQLTRESWAEELKRQEDRRAECLKNVEAGVMPRMNKSAAEHAEAKIAQLADGPVWEPISDEFAAPVETAYQRYVRQG